MATPLCSVPEIEWPALPSAEGAAVLAQQWQLECSQWWPPEHLRAHQFAQIRLLAQHAVQHVPYYGDALQRAGLRDLGELTPETYLRWPVLRKEELRSNTDQLLARRYPERHGKLTELWTTGSTGTPVRVIYTDLALFFSQAISLRDHLLHRRDFSRKIALLTSHAKPGRRDGWGAPVETVYPSGPLVGLSSSLDVDEQLDWLVAEAPAYLMTNASNARALLLRSRETGKVPANLVQLITQGDMPAEDLARLARDLWGASTACTYACQECGPLASQCPEHDHYLVHAENVYVEVLREDGGPCVPGETGRVVVTLLHNFAMPLMRYELGDYAVVGAGCATGRGLPVLERVVGRLRNMAVDPTGRRFWPSFSASVWISVAPFRQVQLIQRAVDLIEARFVIDRDLTPEETGRLVQNLHRSLGYPYRIVCERVSALERDPGGKFEQFKSLLAQ